ncbi:hypothetical protein AA0311_0724 [Asaia bogorensis NBRC 16594]|uniref:Uncharacterized protein n=1 Tax=Asaia bogorensis NBRC 16594 TaxID=1231624 RepID=A0AAN4R159_9PROT|nr:hypothetical protein AA0311_0724 [Asaia bogorensis NBRC 16594]GEL52869.1 hypothetical protein ABO01nite_08760 [Asaia bogorensis NBRC 16594]
MVRSGVTSIEKTILPGRIRWVAGALSGAKGWVGAGCAMADGIAARTLVLQSIPTQSF